MRYGNPISICLEVLGTEYEFTAEISSFTNEEFDWECGNERGTYRGPSYVEEFEVSEMCYAETGERLSKKEAKRIEELLYDEPYFSQVCNQLMAQF